MLFWCTRFRVPLKRSALSNLLWLSCLLLGRRTNKLGLLHFLSSVLVADHSSSTFMASKASALSILFIRQGYLEERTSFVSFIIMRTFHVVSVFFSLVSISELPSFSVKGSLQCSSPLTCRFFLPEITPVPYKCSLPKIASLALWREREREQASVGDAEVSMTTKVTLSS